MKSLGTAQPVIFRIESQASDCLSCDQPVQREERVVTGYPSRIGTRSYGNTHLQHLADWGTAPGLLLAIAFHKVLTLERHSVLNSDSATQFLDALEAAVGSRFTVIEKPMQALQRNFAVYLLIHVQS